MASPYVVLCGLTLAIAAFSYLTRNQNKSQTLLSKFSFRASRSRESLTPPRSLSPSKHDSSTSTPPKGKEFLYTFPPSRRAALAEITDPNFSVNGKTAKELSELPMDTSRILPDDKDNYAPEHDNLFTSTGFTMAEVKALGDFPDYAALSGVPLPEAYPAFNIETAKPRPYRPLRWAYHQTMSFKKMETDWWLELENTYKARISQRQALYAQHGKGVLQALPGTELACKELMEMCLQFLCARYPQYFRLDVQNMVFHNGILDTQTDLRKMKPLEVLLNNVPEDFAMVGRDPKTGFYTFRAGTICSSLGWNVDTKLGMDLKQIHQPIPDYKEKMEFSMDRYFAKKPTDKPIQRGSWGLEIDTPLYMPPDDPHSALRLTQDPTHDISRAHLRVDWQTLRRLPLSGAVVFNFKALFTPVTEFRDEPGVPGLVLKLCREGKKELMEYKGTWHTEHVVVPEMERYEREQREKGMVGGEEEVATLEEYPYFRGWEEKWRRQQGF